MKKILIVATVVKAHIMVFHIPYLKWFKDNGYQTYVCAKDDYENTDQIEIPYCDKFINIEFERSPFSINNIKAYKKLRDLVKNNNFDIIHCHTPVGGLVTRLASRDLNDTKIIYTAHGFHFYKGAPIINWLIYYPVEKFLARFTDDLITINQEDFNRARRFKARNVHHLAGIGVDVKKFSNTLTDRNNKLNSLGISSSNNILVSVGELNKNKNHEVIIRSLATLENKNLTYIICGQGTLKNYLLNLASQLGISKQVLFLGYRSDINEILSVSDMFLFPSLREGLSLSLMEAMSNGLPIICSDIRGNRDLIKNFRGGYLVEPNNIDGYVNAIQNLLDKKDVSYAMGMFNKDEIKKYDLELLKLEMEKIYLS
ncbi:glycosyltransferase [Bacillus sp. JCM 19047]|nr:glycosyltransferase [Bacillus sp. JCM 19047]